MWEMMDYASARKVASQDDLSEFQHDCTIRQHMEKGHEAGS